MPDNELTLSYSELLEHLKDPDSVLHKRIDQAAEEKETQGKPGGRIDTLGDDPFDFNYDDARDVNDVRREQQGWMEEFHKYYSLEEKIDIEYNPDPGIDWGD